MFERTIGNSLTLALRREAEQQVAPDALVLTGVLPEPPRTSSEELAAMEAGLGQREPLVMSGLADERMDFRSFVLSLRAA